MEFLVENGKIVLVRASMVFTYYVELLNFPTQRSTDTTDFNVSSLSSRRDKKLLFELFHLHTAKSKFLHSEIKLIVNVADCR